MFSTFIWWQNLTILHVGFFVWFKHLELQLVSKMHTANEYLTEILDLSGHNLICKLPFVS